MGTIRSPHVVSSCKGIPVSRCGSGLRLLRRILPSAHETLHAATATPTMLSYLPPMTSITSRRSRKSTGRTGAVSGSLHGRGREDAGDRGGAAGDLEPLEDVLQMLADGGGRDHELPGYVAVAVTAGDQGKELLLASLRRWVARADDLAVLRRGRSGRTRRRAARRR